MSDFVFPPPPPPPPKAANSHASSLQSYNLNSRGRASSRGRARGGGFRGVGRGRGGFRGPGFQNGPTTQYPGQNGNVPPRGLPAPVYNLNKDSPLRRELSNDPVTKICEITGGNFFFSSIFPQPDNADSSPKSSFQSRPKPASRPKVEVSPSVPSFGFALPVEPTPVKPPATAQAADPSSDNRKLKRKINQLGLTPQNDLREESEEEDIDEEAVYAAKGLTANLRLEYKGRVYELGTPEGLRLWLEERKENWPTKAKVDEKKKEALKREQEFLRRRLDDDKARRKAQQDLLAEQESKRHNSKGEKKKKTGEDTKKALERHLAKAEKLRKKLEKLDSEVVSVGDGRAKGDNDGKDIANIGSENIQASGNILDEAQKQPSADPNLPKEDVVSAATSSTDASSDSQSDSDSDSSDSDLSSDSNASLEDTPEEVSSKHQRPAHVLSLNRGKPQQICRDFLSKGRCERGRQCRFKHERSIPQPKSANRRHKEPLKTKRKTLFQRLVEQESETKDRLALQAIKYLGQKGFPTEGKLLQ